MQRLPIFAETRFAQVEIRTLHAGMIAASVTVYASDAEAAKVAAARAALPGSRIEVRAV
jgi:hypothetical protein